VTTKDPAQTSPGAIATSDDVKRSFGGLDDLTVSEVLSAQPSLRDLSDAALWLRGDGDLIGREHREITANAQAVIDILERADVQWVEDER
jgi:hypothetical protein